MRPRQPIYQHDGPYVSRSSPRGISPFVKYGLYDFIFAFSRLVIKKQF